MNPLFINDQKLMEEYPILAGIDEAGRGPLAGPVVIASVILKPEWEHPMVRDSKKLTEPVRESLYEIIIQNSLSYHIEIIPPKIIDEMNILQAT
ncbi:MAG TPA: ribonuclease HII, partial [Candidatus Cloacimonadota bacterium]|nr:ribonuclease HII [Candidatus Cloacimonadota bacterium]